MITYTATELRRNDIIDTIARLEHDQRNLETWLRRDDNRPHEEVEMRNTMRANAGILRHLRTELATLNQAAA